MQALSARWRFDFVSRPIGSRQKRIGLVVADNLRGFRVPLQFAAKSGGNAGQMTDVEHLAVAGDVGDWFLAGLDAMDEVCPMSPAFVPFHRQALVDFLQRIGGQRIIRELFHRLPSQLSTVDEDPTLVPFDQNLG